MEHNIILKTERLVIRRMIPEDALQLFNIMKDKETAQMAAFKPLSSVDDALDMINERDGVELFAITTKDNTNNLLGAFQHSTYDEKEKVGESVIKMGYFFMKEEWGKGYATEVLHNFKEYLFTNYNINALNLIIFPTNTASKNVALKEGFRHKESGRAYMYEIEEVESVELYSLTRAEWQLTKNTKQKSYINMEKQKWINEGGVYFPIPGYASIYTSPGGGIFQIYQEQRTGRLGLTKIDEKFTFDFKIYDLECEELFDKVIKTWYSDVYVQGNKNLGVIFNGYKGTGKTIAAKMLSNKIGLPVIVVSQPVQGLIDFIQALCFECIILIDEAEKTFEDDSEVLLKMIDGVYNCKRKLYLLTTNKLELDDNLIGRPGRIRYIKEFGNLGNEAIEEVIKDNLLDKAHKPRLLEVIDTLTISTIDILKSLIDEFNIHGEVTEENMLNLPRGQYHFEAIQFRGIEQFDIDKAKEYIVSRLADGETVLDWIRGKEIGTNSLGEEVKVNELRDFNFEFNCHLNYTTLLSYSKDLVIDAIINSDRLNSMKVIDGIDKYGFVKIKGGWNEETELYCVIRKAGIPSLYHGKLGNWK